MPFYLFIDPKSKKETTLFFHMKDVPSIGAKFIYEGVEMVRLATKPNAAIDSVDGDPFDRNSFMKATDKKGETLGGLWDKAKVFSERRKEKEGIDPISEKYKKEREDQTGVKPLNDDSKKKAAQERLKKLGVSVKEKKQSR
jgi:hypothetical protein